MLSLKCEKTVAVRIAFVAAFLLVVAACLGVSATNTLAAKTHWSDDGPIVGPAPGDGDNINGYHVFIRPHADPGENGDSGDMTGPLRSSLPIGTTGGPSISLQSRILWDWLFWSIKAKSYVGLR